MSEWISVAERLPEEGVEVATKIDNEGGLRNEGTLTYKQNLWWLPDMSMYVYYSPTHWRPSNASR